MSNDCVGTPGFNSLYEETLRRFEDLCSVASEVCRRFSDLGYCGQRPIWTRGSRFLSSFLKQANKEFSALQQISRIDDSDERWSRLRSTNLPYLEVVWDVFASDIYAGVVSLGTSAKSSAAGACAGDITAEYGSHTVKITRLSVSVLRQELAILAAEMGNDDYDGEPMEIADLVHMLRVYKVLENLVFEVQKTAPRDCLAEDGGLLPRVLGSRATTERRVTLLFHNIELETLSSQDREFATCIAGVLRKSLQIEVEFYTKPTQARRDAHKIVSELRRQDEEFFREQVPYVLNFDVTGVLCLVSDITNLSHGKTLEKLSCQRQHPPPSTSESGKPYMKSDNAYAFLEKQIAAEKCHRVIYDVILPLTERQTCNTKLICSRRVGERLLDMVRRMGSAEENRRAKLIFTALQDRSPEHLRGEVVDRLPCVSMIDTEVKDGVTEALSVDFIAQNMLEVSTQYSHATGTAMVATVTGNYKMALQLNAREKRSGSSPSCMLVVNSRSLIGGY
ncbi:uncharacterized protein V1518DRAFT_423824 [Limtongia smithiae]|uniref:uncharacterized protein n=1 Tax=Limtongia smithiae TaxID=1125753 RepID=UPI0034CF5D71